MPRLEQISYSSREVARKLNIPLKDVYTLITSGKLRAKKKGSEYYIGAWDLIDYHAKIQLQLSKTKLSSNHS